MGNFSGVNILMLWRAVATFVLGGLLAACSGLVEGDGRSTQPLSSQTVAELRNMGSSPEAAMMIRIYKEEAELEIWKQVADGSFKLFKSYEICAYSGGLGPKLREGDRQSPEGFYNISPGLMNPRSNYYLAFNMGYPNKFDRAHGRTGSNLMVHGACSSAGCYSMTDEQVAEIYALGRDSLSGGNSTFQVQAYPFRMTAENFARHRDSENMSYWRNLQTGYLSSQVERGPADWDVCGGEYVFNARDPSGAPLDARAACPALEQDTRVVAEVNSQQAAELAEYQAAVADIAAIEARRAEEAARAAAAEQALQERTAAVNNAVNGAVNGVGESIGGFFSGLFGGGGAPAPQPTPQAVPVENVVAPVPAPPIRG